MNPLSKSMIKREALDAKQNVLMYYHYLMGFSHQV